MPLVRRYFITPLFPSLGVTHIYIFFPQYELDLYTLHPPEPKMDLHRRPQRPWTAIKWTVYFIFLSRDSTLHIFCLLWEGKAQFRQARTSKCSLSWTLAVSQHITSQTTLLLMCVCVCVWVWHPCSQSTDFPIPSVTSQVDVEPGKQNLLGFGAGELPIIILKAHIQVIHS